MFMVGVPASLLISGIYVANVRFGSKADMCGAPTHVRFTPNSDRESGHPMVDRRGQRVQTLWAVCDARQASSRPTKQPSLFIFLTTNQATRRMVFMNWQRASTRNVNKIVKGSLGRF
jgi:hypothetical protein